MRRADRFLVPVSAAVVLFLLAGWPGGAAAQDARDGEPQMVTVQATGYGAAYPNDRARSRNEALEAAFRDAVEQASGFFITSVTESRNFELVRDDVLTRSEGFITSYEVLNEELRGEAYVVEIEAVVNKSPFIEDMNASLELLYERVGKPRVMVVVKEDNDPDGSKEGRASLDRLAVTEKEIRRILLKQGFHIIDARTIGGQSILASAVEGQKVRRDKVLDLARTTEAEILILGTSQTTPGGKVSSYDSVQANVSIDVVRVDTGQVMASDSLALNAVHVNPVNAGMEALKKSASGIVPKLMQQVSYQWINERNAGSRIEVVVENISFGDLITFRQALGNTVRGVNQVTQRSYRDGVALLEVTARSDAESLAESIYQTRFETFQVDIRDLTENRLTVSVTTR